MDGIAIGAVIDTAKKAVSLPEPKAISGEGYAYLVSPKVSGEERGWDLLDIPHVDPRPEALKLHTLTGLVDYVKANRDQLKLEDLMIHIVNEGRVLLASKVEGKLPRRTYHAVVEYAPLIGNPACDFAFGKFFDPEAFNIALQALFVNSEDRAAVLACAGNMREDLSKQTEDDGVTQQVTGRAGVHLGRAMPVPNPVTLRPFRTFRDVAQPPSKFVFRVRGGGEGELPKCALFEADGGEWKLEAIQYIRDFLAQELKDVSVAIIA